PQENPVIVATRRGQRLPVRREGHAGDHQNANGYPTLTEDVVRVPCQFADLFAGGDVPQPGRAVCPTRGQYLAIWRERETAYQRIEARPLRDLLRNVRPILMA